MSRTYRSNGYNWYWGDFLTESVEGYEPGDEICYYASWRGSVSSYRKIDPKSKQGKKLLAERRRDKVVRFKEPGPSWFRRLFSQRPYRQEAKRELQKFMVDMEYEPMILDKPKLEYWT